MLGFMRKRRLYSRPLFECEASYRVVLYVLLMETRSRFRYGNAERVSARLVGVVFVQNYCVT